MATARIDAVWVHDGMLDARDYKTGKLWHERVADVPAAKVQAFVLDARGAPARPAPPAPLRVPAAPTCADDPDPWEPDAEDLAAIEEELRAAVERMSTNDDWRGVADETSARAARTARSVATAPRPASPRGRCSPHDADRGPSELRPAIRPTGGRSSVAGRRRCRAGLATRRGRRRARADRPARRRVPAGRRRRGAPRARCSIGSDVVAVAQIGSWRYPDPGRAARAAARHRAARDRGLDRRRQQPAAARQRDGGAHPAQRARRRDRRRRRGDAHALAGAPRAAGRAHVGDRRRPAVRVGDRRRPARCERLRGRALGARAADGVPAVRDRAARRGRSRASTSTSGTSASCGRGSPRSRPTIPNAWSQQAYSPEEIRTRLARQPHGVLPVPEADVRQHRRRPGRGAPAVLLRSGARGRRARRPHGVPARGRRGARPLLLQRTVVARRLAGDRDRGRRRARARPASRSTTSPASTSTRASRRRCRSRSRALGLAADDPAAAHRHRRARLRGRSGQQLPDARDRARWSRCCAPTRRASVARPRSAGTSRSTPPASGRRRRRPTAFGGSTPPTSQAEVDATPRREPAGLVDGAATLEATSVAFERDGTPSLGIVTALTADGRRAMANVRDADALARAHDRGARRPDRAPHQRRHDEHGRSRLTPGGYGVRRATVACPDAVARRDATVSRAAGAGISSAAGSRW